MSVNTIFFCTRTEGKFDDALDLGDRMFDLEKLVAEYAEQINTMDTGLSSQVLLQIHSFLYFFLVYLNIHVNFTFR